MKLTIINDHVIKSHQYQEYQNQEMTFRKKKNSDLVLLEKNNVK